MECTDPVIPENEAQDPGFFAVEPKTDCPHISEEMLNKFVEFLEDSLKGYSQTADDNVFCKMECVTCKDRSENWINLKDSSVYCSRYVKGHMVEQVDKNGAEIAFSLSDGSFWCYKCDSYITNLELGKLRKIFGFIKHKMPVGGADLRKDDRAYKVLSKLQTLNKEGGSGFTFEELVEGLKKGNFKNIVGITGAGISVAAGIPDFRSPGGLYHTLAAEYGLTSPEEIMTLKFFQEHPEPLYKIMKQFLEATIKPTECHKFFKYLEDKGFLLKYFTQNIDGLENEAGMSPSKLLQAHGHIRSCSCSMCKKPKDINELKNHIMAGTIFKCECGGPVKPDVVLFGESLPGDFQEQIAKVASSDLAIIAGSSLKVYPFAFLTQIIPKHVPVVLINYENSVKNPFEKFLFLQGDIDGHVKKIMENIQ